MERSNFHIEILEQGWLEGCSPEEDLCSHGRIRLIIGGQIITSGEQDYGISESALALLRTLEHDHSPELPVAERLIFHGCGAILMMSCPIGIDWSVKHKDDSVYIGDVERGDGVADLTQFPGIGGEVPAEEYRREVVAFAKEARRLFEQSTKAFHDDFDRREYEAFWAEYNQLLERNSDVD